MYLEDRQNLRPEMIYIDLTLSWLLWDLCGTKWYITVVELK
jgi:hypothetical protein